MEKTLDECTLYRCPHCSKGWRSDIKFDRCLYCGESLIEPEEVPAEPVVEDVDLFSPEAELR